MAISADSLFKSRQEQLKNYLSENDIDVAIIMSPINIAYYSGFHSNPHERFFALVINQKNENISLFVPALDVNAAQEQAQVEHFISTSDTENPYDQLRNHLKDYPLTIGIEKNEVSVYRYEQINKYLSVDNVVNIEGFITSNRLKKTENEAARVRRAVELIEKVLDRGIKKVKPGMTELELKAEFEYHMSVLGSEGPSFDTAVLAGAKAAMPHGHPGQSKINHGDFLLIDMGVVMDGYCSDLTRTFIVGEGSEQQKEMYETVLEANKKAIEATKAGSPLQNVDRAARDYIEGKGYGQYFNHRIGHGLGMEVHEAPSIHSMNTEKIEPGLLLTIEPGIYIPEVGGVRIEDDVYVDTNGHTQVLSSYPKSLTYI